MQPGEMNIDPIEAEFFSTEALGSLADALVREAIQNSLDARLPGESLRVRVVFPGPAAKLDGARKQRYLDGLWPHLSAGSSGLTRPPAPGEPMDFVVVEDYGTRGLQGDPAQSEDEELEAAGARNDFYYFWRNIGRSRKASAELGRWGLGKTVFPAASRINSFMALTVRADDVRRLLMGQSVLKIHKVEGRRCYPYGYFGRFEREFAGPIDDPQYLDAFCRDFHIERGRAPGLSVVIPFPEADLTPEAVLPSIVRHYFVPILAGDLRVEVQHAGRARTLNADTLATLLDAAAGEEGARLRRLVELARWGLGVPRERYVRGAAPDEPAAPRWADERLSPEALEQLREPFNRGERVAVTVPVWVKPAEGSSSLASFDVYLERDETLAGGEEHFVRDGITIAGVRASLQKGIRAIVVVRDRALSQLLGDSENPAHTEWQERSEKFKGRYRHGPFTLRYVKNAPREIVRLLTRPTQGRDHQLLRHLFSLDIPTEETVADPNKGRKDKPGSAGTAPGDGAEGAGRDRFFQLQRLRGGFRLAGLGDAATMPRHAAVRVAYETRRGNPFAQYQPLDFEMDRPPVELEVEGADVVRRQLNLIAIRIRAPDFHVTVKGFDVHRDIRVKVDAIDDGAAR